VTRLGGGIALAATCAADASGFVTLDTAQTITGAKIFKNPITVEDTFSGVDRSVLGQGVLTINGGSTGGAARVLLSSSTGIDSATGIVRVFTGSQGLESVVFEASASGANVNGPATYRYNGTSGTTITCGSGQYLNAQTVQGGITTSGTCTSISSGGDMLLGTAQTVTAMKTFQMTFGGDAIRVNNTFGQLRGWWNDAVLFVSDTAGSGRGVQIAGGGVITVQNTSAIPAIRLSYAVGGAASIQVLDTGGITRTGITQTCITTNGGQINFVAGIAISCF
jgi:hypothetical protein